MNESSRVNVKVEPRSTFTLTRDRPYIASILFTQVNLHEYARENYAPVEIILNPVILSCESNSGTKLIPSESNPCIKQIAPNSLIVLLCTLYHQKEEQCLLKLQNYLASYLTSISVCHYVIRFPRISNKVNFFS